MAALYSLRACSFNRCVTTVRRSLPAVGLAIYATRATRVTDEMFIAAAQAVADQVTEEEIRGGMLYPPQSNILQTEITTALRVAEVIFKRDLAGVKRPTDLRKFLESQLYKPEYPSAK
jgi:malate dehydrogenase (oxaloacetate-decarboxylating)(NADP+)